MAPGSSDQLHPATVLAAVATAAIGPEFADELAAYTVILVGWAGGVLWGLVNLPNNPPWSGWRPRLAFVIGTFAAAMFATVAIASIVATIVSTWVPGLSRTDVKDYLFVIATAIPAVGHNWSRIISWSADVVKSRVSRWASGKEQAP